MHRLLENVMAGRPMRRFANEKLQAEMALLPLTAIYTDYTEEVDGTLVVGMSRESQEDRERHEKTLDRLSHLIGGESGIPHRLTYLNVYRDFKCPTSSGGGWHWDDWHDGDDTDGMEGKDRRGDAQRNTQGMTVQTLRGGLSLGCVGTLCLIYSLGRGQQAAILSSHTIPAIHTSGSATGAKIFAPEAPYASAGKRARIVDALDALGKIVKTGSEAGKFGGIVSASAEAITEVIAVVTVNPSLHVRASDASLALLTNQRVLGLDHSIWQASDREYHVTSYVSSVETPRGTRVGMQSAGSAGSVGSIGTSGSVGGGVTTKGHIRHKGCSLRDAWGTLTDQVLADYTAHPGDSGAPVFIAGRGADEVAFVGIHAGRIVEESGRSFSFYSTWEAIKSELQLPAPRW